MLFERRVLSSGNTMQESLRSVQQFDRNGVYGVTSLAEGWLMPNALNILMDGAIDAAAMGEREVFSLSGPDMFRYIGAMQSQLNELYDGLRSVMPELPETLTYHVVCVAEMRFAVRESRMPALNALIDAYLADEQALEYWNARMRGAINLEPLIAQKKNECGGKYESLRTAAIACPEAFYCISDGTFMSQHDLVNTNERIAIHPWALTAPMSAIEKATRSMMRIKR
jgi:hypothetical protein